MNILVFGGTRYMGRHLVNELLSNGHKVTIATRGITPDDFENRVTRLIIDCADAESLKNTIPNILYDVVFDSLTYCSNDVKNLMDTIKCKRYVQISSASVYSGLHNDTKEDEFDACKKALVWCNRGDFEYDEIKR